MLCLRHMPQQKNNLVLLVMCKITTFSWTVSSNDIKVSTPLSSSQHWMHQVWIPLWEWDSHHLVSKMKFCHGWLKQQLHYPQCPLGTPLGTFRIHNHLSAAVKLVVTAKVSMKLEKLSWKYTQTESDVLHVFNIRTYCQEGGHHHPWLEVEHENSTWK